MKQLSYVALGAAVLLCWTGQFLSVSAQSPSTSTVLTDDTQWGPAPPLVPPGAQFAVLEGDPTAADGDYTIRLKMPDGYLVEFGGQFQHLQEARMRLAVVVPATLALIFVLVFMSFRSVRQTLIIYTGVPLAATGGVLALWICGMPFSISAAVGFLLWYTITRDAAEIQPLVPALQSWWMKIHVPANFIGYGTFALAAMVAVAYLLKSNGMLADRLPPLEVLDDIMYKAIAVGFTFFTIATILGGLWAAEAWGGYWSWDPKETWALIVWLNYAAWLHMRLMKGLRGQVAAWWALVGLLVTTFAFLGVNMFLSGLHSYGQL